MAGDRFTQLRSWSPLPASGRGGGGVLPPTAARYPVPSHPRSPSMKLAFALAEPPKPPIKFERAPNGVAIGPGGKVYVSVFIYSTGDDPRGAILDIENGKPVLFATKLHFPMQMVAHQNYLFVTQQGPGNKEQSIVRLDSKGKVEMFVPPTALPRGEGHLKGMTVDPESGTLYVSYGVMDATTKGQILRVSPRGKVDVVLDSKRFDGIGTPEGVAMDGASHLVFSNVTSHFLGTGDLYRLKLADASVEKLAAHFPARALVVDRHGRLFGSGFDDGVRVIPWPGATPVKMAFKTDDQTSIDSLCLDPSGKYLLGTHNNSQSVLHIPISIPGHEVDETPLPLHTEVAFPNLQWTGWKGE